MKKTRSMLAMLMCLAMLVTLLAVNVSAVGTASHEVNVMGLDADKAAGDETKAVLESQGATVPADSKPWQIVNHFYRVMIPAEGHDVCSYVQTLEAPAGEIFNGDVNLEIAYGLACKDADGNPLEKVGSLVVYTSENGQDWTESWANREGQGKLYDSTAFDVRTVALSGTSGMSKVYVKIELVRFSAETSGCIGYSKLTAATRGTNEVVSTIDTRNTQVYVPAEGGMFAVGDVAKEEIERLGYTIEGDNAWCLNSCYHAFMTPREGYQECHLIQTLEAGKGKVFAKDVSVTAGYWLAVCGDPGWFKVSVSTDGETWTEAYADLEGRGTEYDLSAYTEGTITLPDTAGAAKVYVRYTIERHSGPTAGGLTFSSLVGEVKAAPDAPKPDPENPKSGDTISVVLAMAMVCAAGAVITTKKFRKEN